MSHPRDPPAHDPAGEGVDHERHVDEAARRGDVGEVADPHRCDQRLALDMLTPNRAAARWKEAPPATAATTRSRRSTDKGEGIAGSFPGQRPSRRPVATPPGTALTKACLTRAGPYGFAT